MISHFKNPEKFNNLKFPTVKTTVGAIIHNKNKILLTKRNTPIEYGKWCIPGGHIDIGETAVEAIKREVKEETGLMLENPVFFSYFDEFLPEIKTHAIVLIFSSHPNGNENPDKLEVSEQKWFTEEEALKLNLAFKHKEILIKYFNSLQ